MLTNVSNVYHATLWFQLLKYDSSKYEAIANQTEHWSNGTIVTENLCMVSFAVYRFLSCPVTYITFKYFIDTQYRLSALLYYFYVLFILWQVPRKQDTAKDTIHKISAINIILAWHLNTKANRD